MPCLGWGQEGRGGQRGRKGKYMCVYEWMEGILRACVRATMQVYIKASAFVSPDGAVCCLVFARMIRHDGCCVLLFGLFVSTAW